MAFGFELTLLIGAVILAVYYYYTRNQNYWKKRGIKYEKPMIVFGNLLEAVLMKKNQGQIVADVYRKHENEKVVGFFNFDYPALLIRDPEIVYKIYVTDFNHFADNEITVDENVEPILARNMFSQKGEKWKRTRQSLSPAYTPGKIKAFFPDMNQVGEKLAAFISKHPEELELKNLMSLYTSEIVAACGLGIDGHSFTSPQPPLARMGELIFKPGLKRGITQLAIFLAPTISSLFKIRLIPKEVPDFFDKLLNDIINHRQVNYDEKRRDMMQYLIDLKKKSQEVMKGNMKSDVITREFTDDDILNGCITFFVEGYETSATISSFLLYRLAKDKHIQDKVKQEIDDVLKANDGKLTYEAVTDMPYLNNCILETARLHPAIYNSSKSCTKTYRMDIGKNEPLVIEEGITMLLPTYALNTDPKYWKDPMTFDPDRFANQDKTSIPKGVFSPFGDGPRVCIGMRMAYIFMKLGIIHIVKDFEVTSSPRTPVKFVQDPTHFMSSQKGGLYAKFVKRH